MELRYLEYFLVVAEELNFTRAARRLHVAQSGVSAGIRILERELDAPLFERSSKHVSLTDAGAALLPEARAALAAVQSARDAVDQVRGGLRGTVAVGTMTSIGILDMPALIGRFHAEHPAVAIRMMAATSGSAGLAQSLLDGLIDVAFLSMPRRPAVGLTVRRLASVPFLALVPAGHPLADRDQVDLEALAQAPFIDSPVGYGNRCVVDQAMAASGLERRVAVEVADIATAADYVRHGLGVSLMPAFAAPSDDPRLRVRPLTGSPLLWTLEVATVTARRPSAALRALLALVDQHVHSPAEAPVAALAADHQPVGCAM
ncbi:LysR family transcriptional regulator [Kitasatospora sp. NPDC048296]|uniref:LysR family transcriptional regulator n=1 Tax=Kitasatospora sp. NPDC048296 TaxID=3364048 RepID=UPI0037240F98